MHLGDISSSPESRLRMANMRTVTGPVFRLSFAQNWANRQLTESNIIFKEIGMIEICDYSLYRRCGLGDQEPVCKYSHDFFPRM
jgi:hypothetical protein